jgi:hypothetical protein
MLRKIQKLPENLPQQLISLNAPSCSRLWDETTSLSRGNQQACSSYPRWYLSMESHGGMILTGGTNELRENQFQCRFFHHKSTTD